LGTSNSLSVRVRALSADGLILWTGGGISSDGKPSPTADHLGLAVVEGRVVFSFNLGNGEGRIVYNATRVDDGKWHRIRATRYECTFQMESDSIDRRLACPVSDIR